MVDFQPAENIVEGLRTGDRKLAEQGLPPYGVGNIPDGIAVQYAAQMIDEGAGIDAIANELREIAPVYSPFELTVPFEEGGRKRMEDALSQKKIPYEIKEAGEAIIFTTTGRYALYVVDAAYAELKRALEANGVKGLPEKVMPTFMSALEILANKEKSLEEAARELEEAAEEITKA